MPDTPLNTNSCIEIDGRLVHGKLCRHAPTSKDIVAIREEAAAARRLHEKYGDELGAFTAVDALLAHIDALTAAHERLVTFAEKVAISANDTAGTRAAARYALTGSLEGVVDELREPHDA